ncbi:hypothetical protein SAMN02927921_03347 [Sinomicrobium oceani]|uniref:Uncharacterized protein n=1 Tax=Sinomicrobium oceani TaxID=1150368 RepID=A0A1K1RBC0_9FLAO|nr:hypothetical protein SAMN02927921_03347 [Sinomicrobium oceani]
MAFFYELLLISTVHKLLIFNSLFSFFSSFIFVLLYDLECKKVLVLKVIFKQRLEKLLL